jgi:hypothetical protein
MQPTEEFRQLISLYKTTDIEFKRLKPVTVAMWILESGWGWSGLAVEHKNYAGMKFRKEIERYATSVDYEAHDGVGKYCKFASHENFIKGFWAFVDRAPYKGWREHAGNSEDFIAFVGAIWAEDKKYIDKVIDLIDDATTLLGGSADDGTQSQGTGLNLTCEGCGNDDDDDDSGGGPTKPRVDRWEPTSHQSSRNNTDIDHIVIHYTTSRNIEGSISWFKHGSPRTSAHYIIGRDGALVQMVNDSDRAWHAGNSAMNGRSIGIEHVAAPGDAITAEQQKTSVKLIRWLMKEYDVKKDHVIPHVCVKSTSCCGDLFKRYGGKAGESCKVQKDALHAWMSDMGI